MHLNQVTHAQNAQTTFNIVALHCIIYNTRTSKKKEEKEIETFTWPNTVGFSVH